MRVIVFVENQEDVEQERTRVKELLENLRIDATLIVLCLSSTVTYQCIINGGPDVNGRVEDILRDEQWWTDLKHLRNASSASTPTTISALRQASRAFINSLADLQPSSHTELLSSSFARRGSTSSARPSFSTALPPKRRQSLAVLPQSFTMRMGVNKPGFFNNGSSESSSEDESDGYEDKSPLESDDEDEEVILSEDEGNGGPSKAPDYFTPHHEEGSASHTPHTPKSPFDDLTTGERAAFSATAHASMEMDDEDKPHIHFKSTPHPHQEHHHHGVNIDLDFNILPAKAQYLILNDLIRSYSEDTAVVFTTLPAPAPGTYQDEEKSVEYVSGLELLCEDIPPVLLIHSNSLVVTLAL